MTAGPADLQQKLKTIISHTTPLLPDQELRAFVDYYFSRRDRYL
jgi:hypothetical protein